jgi:hypothetical protein
VKFRRNPATAVSTGPSPPATVVVVEAPAQADLDPTFAPQQIRLLRELGFTDHDRLSLRFWFEVSSRRNAIELASRLRSTAKCSVQVRPALRLRGPLRWAVTLRTPPAPLVLEAIRCWEVEMCTALQRPDCRLIGWKPVVGALSHPSRR